MDGGSGLAEALLGLGGFRVACRQVGELARPVSKFAEELGVCWWTVMNAVIEPGTPLVDDPARVGQVRHLGVDETSFLTVNREHPRIYATGLVDLQRSQLIDMVERNAAKDLRRWCTGADPAWLAGIEVVATDLTESYRSGRSPHLDHARRVADAFGSTPTGSLAPPGGPRGRSTSDGDPQCGLRMIPHSGTPALPRRVPTSTVGPGTRGSR